MKLYVIEDADLARLKGVATRLFSEMRMNGDEMRDAAQAVSYVSRTAEQFELPALSGPTVPPGPLPVEEQDAVSAAICERRFSWCRARLLHALAGAADQGVLLEVLRELLPETGATFHAMFTATLTATGWMKGKPLPPVSPDDGNTSSR